MIVDLDAIVRRIVDETIAGVRPIVSAEVRAALGEREHEGLVDLAGLAALLGCSPAAAKTRAHRDPELAALALRVGARRRWRRSEVTTLLESRRGGRAGRRAP